MATVQPEVRTVKMSDGRIVEFAGKKRLIKTSFPERMEIRLDWDNGETRLFKIRDDMVPQFACHGGEQKLGDYTAGMKNEEGGPADTDDLVLATDELIDQLNAGDWSTRREGTGVGGTSLLLQALLRKDAADGRVRPVEKIRAWLKTKTDKEKASMRDSKTLLPYVTQIKEERAAKGSKVDVEAIFAEMDEATA